MRAKKVRIKTIQLRFCSFTVNQCSIFTGSKFNNKLIIFSKNRSFKNYSSKLSVECLTYDKEPPWINSITGWNSQSKSCIFVAMESNKNKIISCSKTTLVKVLKWTLKPLEKFYLKSKPNWNSYLWQAVILNQQENYFVRLELVMLSA